MLAEKLIFTYSSRLIVQLVQIVASIIVARIAGAEVLGTVAFGLAYVTMFTSIADLGLGTAHMKIVSGGEDPKSCLGTFVRMKGVLILAYIIAVIGFFSLQYFVFQTDFESTDHIIVIFILLMALSINEIFAIPKTTFAAYTKVVKSSLPNLIKTLIYQVLRIVIVLLGYKAIALALGNLVSTLIIIPVFWYMFKEYEIGKFDKALAKQYVRLALPMILIVFATKLTSTIDKVLLQFFAGSVNVGYYSAGFRIGGFVLMIGQSVNNLFFPTFSKAFSENKPDLIRGNLKKFERFTFLFIMPFVILITINADVIIKFLLGKEYMASIPIMKAINLAMFLMVASIPFGAVITGKGKFNIAARLNAYNFVVYVIALIILLHPSLLNLKGLGAAVGLIVSYFFLGLTYRWFATRYVKNINHYLALKFIIYGIINYILFNYLLQYQLINSTILWRLLFSVGYVLITYTSFFLFGMMEKTDWNYLKTLISLRKVGKYVKGEMKNKD